MIRPVANLLSAEDVALLVEGFFLDPAIEHRTIPKITKAVPARRTILFGRSEGLEEEDQEGDEGTEAGNQTHVMLDS